MKDKVTASQGRPAYSLHYSTVQVTAQNQHSGQKTTHKLCQANSGTPASKVTMPEAPFPQHGSLSGAFQNLEQ